MVGSTIIAQMRIEEADLARKLKAVRDFLAAYSEPASNDLPAVTTPSGSGRSVTVERVAQPRGKVSIEGYSAYGRQVVAESIRAMLTQPEPMKTRQLVGVLNAMGVAISGENKVNALGALLYRSADIDSHGKAGWTLRDRDMALRIVAEYGLNENGAAEAAPEAEGVAAPSTDNQRPLQQLEGLLG